VRMCCHKWVPAAATAVIDVDNVPSEHDVMPSMFKQTEAYMCVCQMAHCCQYNLPAMLKAENLSRRI
jgi:hypothetical protein